MLPLYQALDVKTPDAALCIGTQNTQTIKTVTLEKGKETR